MPKRSDYDDNYSDFEQEIIDEEGEEYLADLYDLLGDFPEFSEYLEDDFLSQFDDDDFYDRGE